MSEELKPCGSCGSVEAEIGIIGGATFWVECSACGACSSSHDDEYDAIAAWNYRPIEDKLQARIDALEWLRDALETRVAKITGDIDYTRACRIELGAILAAARAAVES